MNECHPHPKDFLCLSDFNVSLKSKLTILLESTYHSLVNLILLTKHLVPMSPYLTHHPVTKAHKLQTNILCRNLSTHAQPPNKT